MGNGSEKFCLKTVSDKLMVLNLKLRAFKFLDLVKKRFFSLSQKKIRIFILSQMKNECVITMLIWLVLNMHHVEKKKQGKSYV